MAEIPEEKFLFWDLWDEAEFAPPEMEKAFRTAMDALGLQRIQMRAKVLDGETGDTLKSTDAATSTIHGNCAFYIMNRGAISRSHDMPGYTLATILHEVLHVFQYDLETAVQEMVSGKVGTGLYELMHNQIDRLSWLLVPLVYTEDEIKGDLFDEEASSGIAL